MDWWKQIPPELLGQEKTGYTGAGPDGVIQPDRRTPGIGSPGSDKHEGEWVFSADETAAIGPDVLAGMAQAVKSGQLDVNAIRGAIGQSPKPGYQAGTFLDAIGSELRSGVEKTLQKVNDPFANPISAAEADAQAGGPSRQPATDPFANPLSAAEADAQAGGPSRQSAAPDPFANPLTAAEADAQAGGPSRQPAIPDNPSNVFGQPIKAAEADEMAGGPPRVPIAPEPPEVEVDIDTDAEGDRDYRGMTDEGMDYLLGIMRGDNPYMDSMFNQAINQMGGASAANIAAMRQQLVQQGASPQAIATAMAAAGAQQSGQMSELMGKLGLEALSQSVSAAQNVITNGQLLEKYDDQEFARMSTDVKDGITMESFLAKYPDATESDFLAIRTTQEPDLGTSIAVSMLEAGDGFSDIAQNPTFRSYVANKYGLPETSPYLDARVDSEIQSVLTKNRDTFQSLLDRDVQNYDDIYPGLRVEQLYDDENVWRNAAYSAGLDPTDQANEEKIKDIIKSRYDEATMPIPEQVWNTLVENNFVPAEFVDDPGTKEATERWIADVYATSFDPETNLPLSGAGVTFPWQNSSTFWHFRDWNNSDITYENGESSYTPDTELSVEGNGAEFGILQPDGSIKPATFADVEAIWGELDEEVRDKYYDGSKFNADLFASDHLRPNGYVPYSNMNDLREQWVAYGDRGLNGEVETYQNEYMPEDVNGALVGGFQSGTVIPDGTTVSRKSDDGTVVEVDLGGETLSPGQFIWYDEKGNANVGNVNSPTFKRIYQQLNRKLGDTYGDADGVINAEEFENLWMGNLDKWIVSEEGEIVNFRPEMSEIATSENNFMIDPEVRRENTTQGTLETIGVRSSPRRPDGFKVDAAGSEIAHYNEKYDGGVYTIDSRRSLRDTDGPSRGYHFNDEVISWAEDNRGEEIYIPDYNGGTYFVISDDPIAYGRIIYQGTSNSAENGRFAAVADYIRLEDPETGEAMLWAPGGLEIKFEMDSGEGSWGNRSLISEDRVLGVSYMDQPENR